MGVHYQIGKYVEENQKLAFEYFEKASLRNHVIAQLSLAYCYEIGNGVTPSSAEAMRWYSLAARFIDRGGVKAYPGMGRLFHYGIGITKNDQEALRMFRQAAQYGDPRGYSFLGLCYQHGTGVNKSMQKAIRYYHQATDNNGMEGPLYLGICLLDGLGMNINEKKAAKYLSLSSKRSSRWSMKPLIYYANHGAVNDKYIMAICCHFNVGYKYYLETKMPKVEEEKKEETKGEQEEEKVEATENKEEKEDSQEDKEEDKQSKDVDKDEKEETTAEAKSDEKDNDKEKDTSEEKPEVEDQKSEEKVEECQDDKEKNKEKEEENSIDDKETEEEIMSRLEDAYSWYEKAAELGHVHARLKIKRWKTACDNKNKGSKDKTYTLIDILKEQQDNIKQLMVEVMNEEPTMTSSSSNPSLNNNGNSSSVNSPSYSGNKYNKGSSYNNGMNSKGNYPNFPFFFKKKKKNITINIFIINILLIFIL